jgi:hypothetical protein
MHYLNSHIDITSHIEFQVTETPEKYNRLFFLAGELIDLNIYAVNF